LQLFENEKFTKNLKEWNNICNTKFEVLKCTACFHATEVDRFRNSYMCHTFRGSLT